MPTLTNTMAGRRLQIWMGCLLAVMAAGVWCYARQLDYGLGLTGMSRDISWGLYVGQFTFTVGIAASAVMLVLPHYLHDCKAFGGLVLWGECVAISAVTVSMLFVVVDLGQPSRVLNVLLNPSPESLMFWDVISLGGYLVLNVVIAGVTLRSTRHDVPPPRWLRRVIIVSIPWAVSIHTVTAFLYCGLPGRAFWHSAILVPRFLASAFASGPALLILVCLGLRKAIGFPPGREALHKLAVIVSYAAMLNLFFMMLEAFTAFYGGIPEEMEHFRYLFSLDGGKAFPAVWMWAMLAVQIFSVWLLMAPRRSDFKLALASGGVFVSLWIDKGLAMIVGGFVPSPAGSVTSYFPTLPEAAITAGIWAAGLLLATVLLRSAIVNQESVEVSH